ncbi:HNH endonuclease signature motif containing protein [Fuscibacter oryzae]|uniref:HNH endonuclease n=1 Tax=Fuscibacter oryzae TaxID=2803939 RepID=A0A8J7MWA6_9RHOB|nr:HNH endonuclease [Fuscibacter oryzae]
MWDDPASTGSPFGSKAVPEALHCTAEHLHPRSEGGQDTTDNIVAACWYCNSRRHRRKHPLSPEAHRLRVQQRMTAGKWHSTASEVA